MNDEVHQCNKCKDGNCYDCTGWDDDNGIRCDCFVDEIHE